MAKVINREAYEKVWEKNKKNASFATGTGIAKALTTDNMREFDNPILHVSISEGVQYNRVLEVVGEGYKEE